MAAGLSALATGLLPVRINVLDSIGAVDLPSLYGGSLGAFLPLAVYALASLWLMVLVVLAFAGRAGNRCAFRCGIILYGADMLARMLRFSIWAFGVHAFFVFKWCQGEKAPEDIRDSVADQIAVPISTQPESRPSPGNTLTDSQY